MWKICLSKKESADFIFELVKSTDCGFIFKDIYYFDKLPSTQDFALGVVKTKTNVNPAVIICNSQTSGKGRNGSSWDSSDGGIWFSLMLETKLTIENMYIVVMVSAICICETIEKETVGLKPDIKWPNDIFVNGKKIAGILLDVETSSDGGTNKVVLGIGVNTNNSIDSAILEVKKNNAGTSPVVSHYQATTLKRELHGLDVSNVSFLSRLLNSLNFYLSRMDNAQGFFWDSVAKDFKERIMFSKNSIAYSFKNENNVEFEGNIVDVSEDGSLLVEDVKQKKIIRIYSAFDVKTK